MDNYYEQNVAGERGAKQQMLYAGCWAVLALLALVALISAAGILAFGEDSMRVNWLNLALTVICAALAVVCYRMKDRVYLEFDYVLWNGELEVCGVYNRRRRKKLGVIPLSKAIAWGPASAMAGPMHGAKQKNWCVRPANAWCVVYPGESGKEAALLEFNEEMCRQIRATNRGLRDVEVKP